MEHLFWVFRTTHVITVTYGHAVGSDEKYMVMNTDGRN